MWGAPGFNKCLKMFIWLELPKAKNSNPQSDQWLKLQSTSDCIRSTSSKRGYCWLQNGSKKGSRGGRSSLGRNCSFCRCSKLSIVSAVALPVTVWKSGLTCSLHWCDLGFFPGKRGRGSQFILSSSSELLYKSWGIGKSKKQSAVFLPCLGGYF